MQIKAGPLDNQNLSAVYSFPGQNESFAPGMPIGHTHLFGASLDLVKNRNFAE